MRTIRIFCARACGILAVDAVTVFAFGAFLASVSVGLFLQLGNMDGSGLPETWALSVSRMLPYFCALLAMRVWTCLKADGRIDMLLTAPVRERDLAIGAFAAVFLGTLLAMVLSSLVPLGVFPFFARCEAPGILSFLPGSVALAAQGALWCAVVLAVGTLCRSAAVAACSSVILCAALPRGIYLALLAWSPEIGERLGMFPFDAHVSNSANGIFSSSAAVFYLALTIFALMVQSKVISCMRHGGYGGRKYRRSTAFTIVCGAVFTILLCVCAQRLDWTQPMSGFRRSPFKPSIGGTVAELKNDLKITLFMSRGDSSYRNALQVAEALKEKIDAAAMIGCSVCTVDPRWDRSAAIRLMRENVVPGSVMFESERRTVLKADDMNGVTCENALKRLVRPLRRSTIYFTCGHGEADPESYDAMTGMSRFARELAIEGHIVKKFNPAEEVSVPEDCEVLVVAGAREAFSETESAAVESWLLHGGRMMVFTGALPEGGVSALLKRRGLEVTPFTAVSPGTMNGRTIGGGEVVVSDFGEHRIMVPLAGTSLIFGSAAVLRKVDDVKVDADSEVGRFTVLAKTGKDAWGEEDISTHPWTFNPSSEPAGPLVLAVALERGTSDDDAVLRPIRIVAIGDASFALNGSLSDRANANNAFLINCFAWLAGLDPASVPPEKNSVMGCGMERGGRLVFAMVSVVVWPFFVMLTLFLYGAGKRRLP